MQPTTRPTTGNPTTAPTTATRDTTVPSTPTNLTAASSGNNAIRLSWTGSTDNVRVTEYIVYRSQGNGSANTGINWNSKDNGGTRITGTTYTNTGLTPGTAYYYYVRALDAAGNRSGQSNTAGVTLAGATPAKNTITGTVALSDGKSANIKINLLKKSDLTNPIMSESRSKEYTFKNVPNGDYVVRISYGAYADKTCNISFKKTTGDDKATCNATLKPK